MRYTIILLSIIGFINLGCNNKLISSKDIKSIEVQRISGYDVVAKTLIKNQITIERILNNINNSHKEPCIFRKHYDIIINHKTNSESIGILGKYFNRRGITYEMDNNLENELQKIESLK